MADHHSIPDKLYFRIGEVGKIAEVPTYVLRFWESEFPTIKPKRTESGQRLYRKADVELILDIKHLLHDRKFTIKGAKQHLKAKRHQRSHTAEQSKTKPQDKQSIIQTIRSELQAIRTLLD